MIYPPLAENPLRTRADLQAAMRDLFAPLEEHYARRPSAPALGDTGAHYAGLAAGVEAFSRPLWGLVPLAAGGGQFAHWELLRRGLGEGVDPRHPDYWGHPARGDQRHVEMAVIGLGLCLAREHLWEPLAAETKQALATWLGSVNTVKLAGSNWQFFRVLTNLGLHAVGAPCDRAAQTASLDLLETQYLGDGWYSDGPNGQRDYYVPFAMHYFGLIYARLAGDRDPARAARFRERAAIFARDFLHWHAADGSTLPYGRSLTYRFGQVAFWPALAFAGVEVEGIGPGVMKGLVLRHLRGWFRRPIFTDRGVLTIGYGYPNLQMAENYNAPGSPYWGLKTMLALALPEDHAFWSAEEEPLPKLAAVQPQPHARLVLCREPDSDNVVALCGGQVPVFPRHAAAKYGKFAYSTHFGFGVPTEPLHLHACGLDNTLALSDDGLHWRVRGPNEDPRIEGDVVRFRWCPWPDVEVTTWLAPAGDGWHARLHRLRTPRALHTAEGGFPNLHSDAAWLDESARWLAAPGLARIAEPGSFSGIRDLLGGREGRNVQADANSNLLHPRTVIPALAARLEPGEHWLAAAVLGRKGDDGEARWEKPPTLVRVEDGFALTHAGETRRIATTG